jgi:ribosome maturation factor RimP
MPGGSRPAAGLVDDRRLAGLIRPVVAAAGMDLESVRVTVAGRRRLLRIVVDSDHGVSLDDAALVSREVSTALDASDVMDDVPYTLEVSSPGVNRPLTEPRHWRRAVGRLVRVKAGAEGTVQGRVLAADAEGVTLDLSGVKHGFAYGDLGPGAVQVEFGRIPDAELEELSGAEFPDDSDEEDEELAGEFSGEPSDGLADVELPYEADLGTGGDGH